MGLAHRTDSFVDRLPNTLESQNAEQLVRILASQRDAAGEVRLNLSDAAGAVSPVTLSPAISGALLEVLRLVASGQGFSLVPVQAELTTKQAADHLNVSRPFLVKLLEEGEIPFHKVGRHRRILAEDLFAYRARRDAARREGLSALAQMDQDDDLI